MTQGQDEAALIGPAGVPRQVTARATWLLAPNPSPMTFDGTNSWVLHEPGRRGAVIVDPGPDDPGHLSALVELALDQGGRVDAILLTHGHSDHSAGLRETARRTGAPVLGASSRWCDQVIGGGPLDLGGLRVDVIPTPGHSSDSLSFHLPADESMVTGDTVLGRSAPAIMDPDGRVDQTIDSLSLIKELLADGEPLILPGHGPLVTDPRAVLAFALTAREARLAQVEGAVRDGHGTVGAIADRLYGPFDERIRRMIEATVRAHLRYLHDRRRLSRPVQIDG
jgi:glyoxylase-like metal-dependent hydrolase (beta-lactamase superfamily II)